MLRTTAALVALVAALSFAWTAWASQRQIAVLQPDEELLRAVSLALSPWGLETMSSDAPLPGSSQPEAAQAASRLARQLEVEALVWITSPGRGSLLWVFDVRTGNVTTRQVPQTPPFDSASAAAVALSVKTVLRSSTVAPPEERFGAPAPPAQAERGTTARTTTIQPPPAEGTAASTNTATASDVAAVEIGASGYWIGKREIDPRLELAGVLWIPAARRVGLSLETSSGPGVRVDTPDYEGRYRELVFGARARFRVVPVQGLWAVFALGGAAHFAMLRGTLTADSLDRDVNRLNGSLDFETSINFDVSSGVYLGVGAGTAYFPRYRRYLVHGNPVFSPWPLTVQLTGYCGVEVF